MNNRIANASPPDVASLSSTDPSQVPKSSSHFRWVICALLFFATTINYVDRQVLGILATPLQREIGWSESDYGWIVTSFQAAYALAMLLVGKLIDRIGTRIGYALTLIWWSIAAMAHGSANTAVGFGIARFALGFGEAGNFPAAVKTVAEWFPKHERAFATGIFNSGSNIGAVIAPLLVPWIALNLGWRWAFLLTGGLGFVWLIFWWWLYHPPQHHPRLRKSEWAHIHDELGVVEPESPVPWRQLLGVPETWALAAARFMTDPIWWFYLYWAPKFFNTQHGLTLGQIGLPLIVIYLAADVGSVGGGWFSSYLIRRQKAVLSARKTAMLVSALAVTPMAFAVQASNLWTAVAMISLATAAHQGWSANMFTLVSDLYPQRAVASMVGFSGFAGSIGGMLFAASTGFVLQWTGSYLPMFMLASGVYLVGLGLIHLATGKNSAKRLQARRW